MFGLRPSSTRFYIICRDVTLSTLLSHNIMQPEPGLASTPRAAVNPYTYKQLCAHHDHMQLIAAVDVAVECRFSSELLQHLIQATRTTRAWCFGILQVLVHAALFPGWPSGWLLGSRAHHELGDLSHYSHQVATHTCSAQGG